MLMGISCLSFFLMLYPTIQKRILQILTRDRTSISLHLHSLFVSSRDYILKHEGKLDGCPKDRYGLLKHSLRRKHVSCMVRFGAISLLLHTIEIHDCNCKSSSSPLYSADYNALWLLANLLSHTLKGFQGVFNCLETLLPRKETTVKLSNVMHTVSMGTIRFLATFTTTCYSSRTRVYDF